MSAVTKGIETDLNFLRDLLPAYEYDQNVYRKNEHYAIEIIKKDRKIMRNWSHFYETLKTRYAEKLMEVYSITSDGVHFIIYIKI